MSSNNGPVRTQAAWAIGNIAGDSQKHRDRLINEGVIPPLIRIHLGTHESSSQHHLSLRISSWTIGNLCRYRHFDWDRLQVVFPFVCRLICDYEDDEIISEGCWALQRIFNDRKVVVRDLIDSELCTRMVQLLHCKELSIVIPVLKATTNILSSDDDAPNDFFIEQGLLTVLCGFLVDGVPSTRLESLFVLSNIAAGSCDQVSLILYTSLI